MRRPGGSTWEERFLGSSSEIETYVFTKVEARATFTLSLGFRVCARAKASRMGHDNIWYSRPRKFGASARLAAMAMVSSGNETVHVLTNDVSQP